MTDAPYKSLNSDLSFLHVVRKWRCTYVVIEIRSASSSALFVPWCTICEDVATLITSFAVKTAFNI